ncbi:MAG: FG-GAP-like repeat-containing protein [bacterium]
MARCRPQPSTLLFAALLASSVPVGGAAAIDQEIRWHAASLESGGEPFDIAAADFDGDGRLDIASTNARDSTVSVFLNRGDGRFAARQTIPTGSFPRGLVAADLTRDGLADLAVASTGLDQVDVYVALGGGRFAAPRVYPVGKRPFLAASADWNGDGKPDLAVANEARDVSLLIGDGQGGFVVQTIAAGALPSAVAAGDWDGDGHVDLAVTNWGSNTVTVHRARGAAFAPPSQLTFAGFGMFGIVGGDLDRDGYEDLAWNDIKQSAFWIAYGDADGAFRRSRQVTAGPGVRSVRARDLDGDGWPDLVGADTADGSVSVALADGRGGYGPTQYVPVGLKPRVAEVADLNGDGRPDVAVTNMDSDVIVLLFNQGLVPRAAPLEPGPMQTAARLDVDGFVTPSGLALAPHGGLLVADQSQHRVLRLPLAGGRPVVVVGSGLPGCSGDRGAALSASLHSPSSLVLTRDGGLWIADTENNRIRRVDASGTITTVAGGDGDVADTDSPDLRSGDVRSPDVRSPDVRSPDVHSPDVHSDDVRSADTGSAQTASATPTSAGADSRAVYRPNSLALAADGSLFFVEQLRGRIRRLAPDGNLHAVAGTGTPGLAGDGGAATAAQIAPVVHLAISSSGELLLAEPLGRRIRRIDRQGIIATLAGGAPHGSPQDIGQPCAILADHHGGAYFGTAEALMHIAADGRVHRVVDLADAHKVGWLLSGPTALVLAPDGRFIAADSGGHVLRLATDGRAEILAPAAHIETASAER